MLCIHPMVLFHYLMTLARSHIGHGSHKRRATHHDSGEMHMLQHEDERVSPVSSMSTELFLVLLDRVKTM